MKYLFCFLFRIVQTEDAAPEKKVELKKVLVENASLVMTAKERATDENANVVEAAEFDDVDSSFKEIIEESFSEGVESVSQNSDVINE